MKKAIKFGAMILTTAAIALSIVGCSSKTCSVCGKSYSSGGSTTTVLGEEVNICDDCLKSAGNALGGIGDAIGGLLE